MGEISTVPFGKYKGQSVDVLAADQDYCEWLMAQPWFRDRWPTVYNVVINYGGEPQDSPEHNQMQAAFLDNAKCFALADLLYPTRMTTYGVAAVAQVLNADPMYRHFSECIELEVDEPDIIRQFEDHGWDVTFRVEPAAITAHRTHLVPPLPACTCVCDHESDCTQDAVCRSGGTGYCRHRNCKEQRGMTKWDHRCTETCYWHTLPDDECRWLQSTSHFYQPTYDGTVRVELKPDLGDDYPAVLRQVNNYPCDSHRDKRCVVVRRADFQHVTLDQVTKIFAASRIRLLMEQDFPDWAPDPNAEVVRLVLGASEL